LAGTHAGLFFLSLEGTMADPLSTSINPVNDIQARQFISIFADATTAPVLTTPDLDTCLTYSRRQDANVNPPDPYVTWQAAPLTRSARRWLPTPETAPTSPPRSRARRQRLNRPGRR
jgi:hypothetical protein